MVKNCQKWSTMVLGRSTMVLRRCTMVLGRCTMLLGRSTMVTRRSTMASGWSAMAMEGLVCSRSFQKHITLGGPKLYITPLIHAHPWPPHRGVRDKKGLRDSPRIAQVIFEAKRCKNI